MRRFTHLSAALAALGSAIAIFGCGGAGSALPDGAGTLELRLADAPDPTISAISVTIDRVEAHVDGSWIPVTTVPLTFDLFSLIENDTILGSANLPPGRYTQIRLFPSAASVTDADGTHDVKIPSGVQSGIKLKLDYEIVPGETTAVLLDFNVAKSLHKTGSGKYILNPVIPVVVKNQSGVVTGLVTDGTNPAAGAYVSAVYTAGTSYPIDSEVNSSVTQADGTFKMWALLPGTYTLYVNYTQPGTGVAFVATYTGLEVTASGSANAGTIVVVPAGF